MLFTENQEFSVRMPDWNIPFICRVNIEEGEEYSIYTAYIVCLIASVPNEPVKDIEGNFFISKSEKSVDNALRLLEEKVKNEEFFTTITFPRREEDHLIKVRRENEELRGQEVIKKITARKKKGSRARARNS